MALSLIGLGLFDEKDITLRGLELVKAADIVYLERYTSILQCPTSKLEKLYGKKVLIADRDLIEQQADQTILKQAETKDVAILIVGDPLGATTHTDLLQRARERGIAVTVVPNASIFSAIGATGLQLYKFGKTASIPFYAADVPLDTPLRTLEENLKTGAHTLFLLDLDPTAERYMTVNDAIEAIMTTSKRKKSKAFGPKTLCIGCARLGSPAPTIKAGTAQELEAEEFGKPPHCLIVPGKLHFMEEEAITHIAVTTKGTITTKVPK